MSVGTPWCLTLGVELLDPPHPIAPMLITALLMVSLPMRTSQYPDPTQLSSHIALGVSIRTALR